MNIWNCDICGKRTYMNPEHEVVKEKVGKRKQPAIDKATGQPLVKMNGKKVEPVFEEVDVYATKSKKMYQQNLQTGKITTIDVPEVIYKQEPCILVRLKCGNENFQRDFCQECLDKHLGSELKALRTKLIEVEGK